MINACYRCLMPALILGSILLLSGCGPGLPDDVRQSAQFLSKDLEATQTLVREQKEKFDGLAAKDSFAPLAGYAAKENWGADFIKAEDALARAKTLYDNELSPLLKADTPESAPAATAQITRIQAVAREAKSLVRSPFDRMERIRAAMTRTQGIYDQARTDGDTVLAEILQLEAGPVAEALEKFPDAAEKISNRFSPFAALAQDARAAMTSLEYQFQAHESGNQPDYAALADAADSLAQARTDLKKTGPRMEADLSQLYQSYTKVLQDMKVTYFLTVKRESWDEASDYDIPRTATFPCQVSAATYEALAESTADSIAELRPSLFGKMTFINNVGSAWEGLSINAADHWPDRRHNAATFWIEETREEYFHKYLQESNGETTETDWVQVSESVYEQNEDNLGMAILSKPFGEFEPDPVATPPGMAYVGNPAYGEWKKDDSGNSFWSWYGRYAFFSNLFFFPPSYYYWGSWNRWRTDYRQRQPYYGDTGREYGTSGSQTKNAPRYQNTTFAKTGGFKTAPASVRGASLRGGGPGGKGK